MKKKEKRNPHGLERMIFIEILLFSTLLSFVTLMAGVSQYVLHIFADYKRETTHELEIFITDNNRDLIEGYYVKTRELYEKVADEYTQADSAPVGKDSDRYTEYKDLFSEVEDSEYKWIRRRLLECVKSAQMEDIAFIFYDEKRERMVIVMDGDEPQDRFEAGQWLGREDWDIPTKKKIDSIVSSPVKVNLARGTRGGWTLTDYDVFYGKDGKALGYICAYWDVTEVMARLRNFVLISFPVIVVLVGIFAQIISRSLHRKLINPVVMIAKATREYSEIDADELETADPVFASLDPDDAADEIGELVLAMQRMEETVSDDMRQIRTITASRQRVEAELAVAANIQKALLPDRFDGDPEECGYDICGFMRPAREVGGDFYDHFMIDDDHLAFLVADVSDKGAGAAMFMAVSRAMIRMRAQMGGSPSEIISDVDNLIYESNGENMFVTVWMGVLEISTGHVEVCNAGHEYPVICRRDPENRSGYSYELYEREHGSPVAFLPGLPFPQNDLYLKAKERIVIFTDGVTEARNPAGEMFETDRIIEVLIGCADEDVRFLADKLREEVDSFAKGVEQFDDITILVLEYTGNKN